MRIQKPARLERKDSAMGCETRSFRLDIKGIGEDGTITGYGSVFGVKDTYDDVVAKGAFVKSLNMHKSEGTMPAMLWQHKSDKPLGVWTEMIEDAKGLKVTGQLALDTEQGAEAYVLLKMGAINGLSIGFMSVAWAYNEDTETRTLTEIDLWEVSLVTFPANGKSRVTGVKSVEDVTTIRQAEKVLRDAGFSVDATRAFISSVKSIVLGVRDAPEIDAEAANKIAARAAKLQRLIQP